jgi:transglutaminase-like putative cysteine protease
MLSLCRCENIPARYVSGYLYGPGSVGDDAASHAWVDVFIAGKGWVSLDPTHNTPQTEKYVRLGVGRDYSDVPPTRGTYRGTAEEQLEVKVSVREI